MSKVTAGITVSVDGYIAAPDDGPGRGLGAGGERLHNWVFGGPWRYDDETRGEPASEDAAWMAHAMAQLGAVVTGRTTYEAAGHWGEHSPWEVPVFVVTHRSDEQPHGSDFSFVSGVEVAVEAARSAAGGRTVNVMGGADTIRQALAAHLIEELTIIVAPVILGAGKRLFDGFSHTVDLEQIGARQSPFATFLDYRVKAS
ncbi:MAG: dihydrofolate reductase family protein [Solirubrobacteraceae bacterium]